jgi:hypothetical protein
MVYFVMALALFDDDYEEVAARLTETLTAWGCWDDSWSVPTSGGITQARQRLGYEPVKKLFAGVAAPVAEELTAGAFPGPWRLMAIDGFGWDAPDTPENAAASGFAGTAADETGRPAYPKVRVVTVSECAWHAVADAAMGAVAGKGAGEQSLARELYRRLKDDWLLIADRNFFNWADWCTAADTGAQLLWRVKADLTLPGLALLPDGSCSPVLVNPKIRGKGPEGSPGGGPRRARPGRGPGPLCPGGRVRGPGPGRRRQRRGDRPGHHDHRDDGSRSAAAGGGLPPKVGA